ncbi:MAG: hypothetical protein FWD09_06375 [Lentimicrobiaceae bacterium]|nr:hypothetical protein [Lentimicrobiaceae bacterium]
MKKLLPLVILLSVGITKIYAQQPCHQCNGTAFMIGTGTATGNNSFAGGNESEVFSNNGFVFGNESKVFGLNGIALGNFAQVFQSDGIAMLSQELNFRHRLEEMWNVDLIPSFKWWDITILYVLVMN